MNKKNAIRSINILKKKKQEIELCIKRFQLYLDASKKNDKMKADGLLPDQVLFDNFLSVLESLEEIN